VKASQLCRHDAQQIERIAAENLVDVRAAEAAAGQELGQRGELGVAGQDRTVVRIHIRADGHVAGHTVYVGRGARSNGGGIRQLRSLLAPLGRTVIAVPLANVLHLKSAVTALPDGTFLLLPGLVPAELFPAVRPVEEEGGCHVVPLGGDRVLIAASAPRTAEMLDSLGFTPAVVDIGEFEKLEGCVTCLSVLF
jgi:N-dimethylarginine dimethylaminohydrolase